jgi:type II secretory pathway pseudopilin PulG
MAVPNYQPLLDAVSRITPAIETAQQKAGVASQKQTALEAAQVQADEALGELDTAHSAIKTLAVDFRDALNAVFPPEPAANGGSEPANPDVVTDPVE